MGDNLHPQPILRTDLTIFTTQARGLWLSNFVGVSVYSTQTSERSVVVCLRMYCKQDIRIYQRNVSTEVGNVKIRRN